jgi:hypothetical protein
VIAESRRRRKRKELVVMKACRRLRVYEYRDVMKALRAMARSRPSSSPRSVVCAREVLTEKEVIRILSIARWHVVLVPGTKRRATRYEYVGFRRVGRVNN